jgi:hypothetical protein
MAYVQPPIKVPMCTRAAGWILLRMSLFEAMLEDVLALGDPDPDLRCLTDDMLEDGKFRQACRCYASLQN